MRPECRRSRLLHVIARELATRGLSVRAIARTLHISSRTVYRFQRLDAAEGLVWRDMRSDQRGVMSVVIVALLERRIGEALADDQLTATQRADAVWKIQRTLEAERAHADAVKEASADAAC